jgi:hypothetical protein
MPTAGPRHEWTWEELLAYQVEQLQQNPPPPLTDEQIVKLKSVFEPRSDLRRRKRKPRDLAP